MEPEEYFGSHERDVNSLADLYDREQQIGALADLTGLAFYWRGQSDAAWGVHSALHRSLAAIFGIEIEDLSESHLVTRESEIVPTAREWIRPEAGARLTTVDLLARLQHFGVPTRLLDFTLDSKVATYFAVTEHGGRDGRLIVAAARRSPSDDFRNSFSVPWSLGAVTRPHEWASQLYALDDHADFLRIIRQRGVFLTGGTPTTRPRRRDATGLELRARDVRRCMSLPLALHSWTQAEGAFAGARPRGRKPTVASTLTLRIPQRAKSQIRRDLEAEGYSMRLLFPDTEGYKANDPVVRELLSVGV